MHPGVYEAVVMYGCSCTDRYPNNKKTTHHINIKKNLNKFMHSATVYRSATVAVATASAAGTRIYRMVYGTAMILLFWIQVCTQHSIEN